MSGRDRALAMAASSVIEMQEVIRRNAEDLREELASLEHWEEEMSSKPRKGSSLAEPDLPPVRGTPQPQKLKKKDDPVQTAREQGNEYFRLCKYEDAARSYSKGIAYDPDNNSMHILYGNRAMCYIKLQMWDLAEKDATVCIQMNRTYVKGFFRRAVARKAMGKLKDARADLETVLVLSPGDKEAENELKSVSSLLQQQLRAQQTSSGPGTTVGTAKKKKLVIEEVDDEVAPDTPAPPETAVDEMERQARHNRDLEDARRAEAERAALRRKAAEEEEKRLQQTRRTSNRVEEIVEPPAKQVKPSPMPKHTDPALLSRKPTVQLKKESLAAPKSFPEFELHVNEIVAKAPLLLEHYLDLLPAANWTQVIGSSITPDLACSVISAASDSSPVSACNSLSGLASLPRVQEVLLFLEDTEKDRCNKAIDKAMAVATEADQARLLHLRSMIA